MLNLGELEGDREHLSSRSLDSRFISLVILRATAVRASASAAVAINSAILCCFLPAQLCRCRAAAEANGPERSPDSVMAKTYRHLRPLFELSDAGGLNKFEKKEGVSGGAVLARLVRHALELRWECC